MVHRVSHVQRTGLVMVITSDSCAENQLNTLQSQECTVTEHCYNGLLGLQPYWPRNGAVLGWWRAGGGAGQVFTAIPVETCPQIPYCLSIASSRFIMEISASLLPAVSGCGRCRGGAILRQEYLESTRCIPCHSPRRPTLSCEPNASIGLVS